MKHKQLSLFGHTDTPVHSDGQGRQRRYNPSTHWSYRQRLIHLVSSSKSISWKSVYRMLKARIINVQSVSRLPYRPTGRKFLLTINQKRMSRAVITMYHHKHGDKHFKSINRIAKHYHVSRASLYRYYHQQYK